MMIKIAINGFGRIGRQTFRRIIENHPDLEVVAINDLTDNKTMAHLLKYDSIYGKFDKEVSFTKEAILLDGKEYMVLAEKEPEKLPWKKLGIDIVLECTGLFTNLEDAKKHIKAGAKKVIISAPSKDKEVPGFILGVNADKFEIKDVDIMDMGSCTTNCLAPIAKVLNDKFKIVNGFMTTIHSYTNDQRILDLPHKDLRRARAAAINIIPTSTGAAKAIGKIIPELNGKLDGISIRVPTPIVSVLDLVVHVEKSTT
ncbi:MAG: type I glyceraldehyde-3-phosphate dehydrogenase, partial [Candidatus Staskawiczbacteria bacterium]|nr:type I glyceraldehyde-3-phosphate dehydrogenase [Candidatus Staskawiczbacteria bacterium]